MKRSEGNAARVATGLAVLFLVITAGCRTGRNYPGEGPRYAGDYAADGLGEVERPGIRVVSFNVKFAESVDSAIVLLARHPDLRDADILLLQEMDGPSTERVAEALGLRYVFYPAVFHLRSQRDFGNAVLAPWPIVDDTRVVLPYPGVLSYSQRTATGATVCVAGTPVRAYSAHLATLVEILPRERRSQVRAIMGDAEPFEYAVIGGDMNDSNVGEVIASAGFDWPTEVGPRTVILGRWDHIFARGFSPAPGQSAGTVLDNLGSSDHLPVWAVMEFDSEDGDLPSAESCAFS